MEAKEIHHCDNCGDQVDSFTPDPTILSFTYTTLKNVRPHPFDAKVDGDKREWPFRWGIGCSCYRKRHSK